MFENGYHVLYYVVSMKPNARKRAYTTVKCTVGEDNATVKAGLSKKKHPF